MRKLFLIAAAGLLLFTASVGLGACKQGEGEICQIDDDCEDGLECNAGTGRCQEPGADIVDSGPIEDFDAAPPPDAAPPDAEVDSGS